MDVVRRFDNDRFFKKSLVAVSAALILVVASFGAYYYTDRHSGGTAPLIDRELSQVEQLVKNDPANPAARVALANVYFRKGDDKAAIDQYNQALKADDKNLDALAGLGLALYRTGKINEAGVALAQVTDATKDDPASQRSATMSTVHYLLGKVYSSQGNLNGAEQEFKSALMGNQTDSDTMVAAAKVETQLGKSQDAIDLYRTALQFVPNFQEAYEGLATAYASSGMTVEASYAKAMVDFCKGSYQSAAGQLEAVVKAKPDFPEAYYGLGASYDKTGNKDAAITAFQKAVELKPDFAAAQAGLARLGASVPASATPAAGH